ncbi:unnamed protein product [Acanthoscelides obtectus]|uniref:DDE Tnp4 domain-containing protein n=1 Tax=Acanthoscelides obtectus TaxID=200917 RepID=A0A9P0P076_ACAOB|nr:unnamed protein product [Acanthoscelides obtectus]CAK1625276.1 hypothetical protein AOBTE_LOCUS3079 [Acanthoscelides obtectus]
MTPYRDPLTPERISYNRSFTRERVIIERCFGQVKQRFPILQTKIRIKTEKYSSLILSCFILHDVAKHLNEENFEISQDLNNNGDEAIQMPAEYGLRTVEDAADVPGNAELELAFSKDHVTDVIKDPFTSS